MAARTRNPHPFVLLDTATRAAASCLLIARQCRCIPGDMPSQLARAAASVALNIAEGNGRKGKERLYHFRVAYSSSLEATTALRLLVECKATSESTAVHALDLLDEVRAMSWRLMHGGRGRAR